VLFAIDAAYSVLSTCDPVGERARQATDSDEHCSFFTGPLVTFIYASGIWLGHLLENSPEALIAGFAVVLAFSTTLLWLATERLYADEAQQKHVDRVAQQTSDMQQTLERTAIAAETVQRSAFALAEHARATRSLADAARDAAERQLRAYVHINKAVVTNLEGVATYVLEIQNRGQTPAYKVEVWGNVVLWPDPCVERLPASAEGFRPFAPMGPGAIAYRTADARRKLTDEEFDAIARGRMAVYYYGAIRYVDAWGKQHTTSYRYQLGGSLGMTKNDALSISEDGNDAD
jgi:hypothetical protein